MSEVILESARICSPDLTFYWPVPNAEKDFGHEEVADIAAVLKLSYHLGAA